jgi:hypothetical protein
MVLHYKIMLLALLILIPSAELDASLDFEAVASPDMIALNGICITGICLLTCTCGFIRYRIRAVEKECREEIAIRSPLQSQINVFIIIDVDENSITHNEVILRKATSDSEEQTRALLCPYFTAAQRKNNSRHIQEDGTFKYNPSNEPLNDRLQKIREAVNDEITKDIAHRKAFLALPWYIKIKNALLNRQPCKSEVHQL